MTVSNCIDILKLGSELSIAHIVNESTKFVSEHVCDIDVNCGDQLYSLPKHLFKGIFDSYNLILKSQLTGITYTGLMRELQIITFLDMYIKLHPEMKAEF
jgi:hypothetical protein